MGPWCATSAVHAFFNGRTIKLTRYGKLYCHIGIILLTPPYFLFLSQLSVLTYKKKKFLPQTFDKKIIIKTLGRLT